MRSGPTKGAARLVLPRLTEPHVHLDKCHTVDRLGPVGGNLHDAITAQFEDKQRWTTDDLHHRASRGLRELATAGCRAVRSHVDWHREDSAAPPEAWHVLCDLRAQMRGTLDLQLSPLIGVDTLAQPALADAIAQLASETGDAMGCFVYDQPRRAAGIQQAFRSADKYSVPLDFHVDEGLDADLDGLSLIADTALQLRFEGPILCGHACSLMNLTGDPLKRLLDKVARAGLHIVTLPTTNLYLQGRTDGTPDRRGLTRIRELQNAGVNVIVGTDNVRDAFCPVGQHDPVSSLALAILGGHLDPPLGRLLPMITTQASSALGLPQTFVDGAAPDDLLVCDTGSVSDLLAGTCTRTPLTTLMAEAAQ
ncbi:amidohydrolase family protein [Sulfitobacter sp. TSTF-M16]|uniref:Amidohydrolase family protein n=2 Tax=Sulfitobacter aestuariivivens TaxID=2766981 RepID=A0A927D5E2_9RHOB|nr:amidohydrolase family protein [Sulfitobacter aestuariivivens]